MEDGQKNALPTLHKYLVYTPLGHRIPSRVSDAKQFIRAPRKLKPWEPIDRWKADEMEYILKHKKVKKKMS